MACFARRLFFFTPFFSPPFFSVQAFLGSFSISLFPFGIRTRTLALLVFFSSSVYKYINLGLVFFLFCVNHSTCLLFLLLRLLIKEQNFLFLSVLVFISSFSGLLCSVEEVPFFLFFSDLSKF